MTVSNGFTAGVLPDSEKEALCYALLNEFGVSRISANPRTGELVHGCLVSAYHQDQDRNPTASLNYKKLTYNPVAGETLVKTYDGERPISELSGGKHLLMDGRGEWVQSEVISSGVHPLLKVTLIRNGRERVVYATAEHRWLIRPNGSSSGLVERTSATLAPRDRIPSIWGMKRTGRTTLSRVGVMAGFVYGDGSRTWHGAVANFCGSKDEALLSYFDGYLVHRYGDVAKVIAGLPRSWKDLPSLDEGASYLYGWLAGYFAADGCVADDGHATMSSASLPSLRHVVAICERLGIATWGVTSAERHGYGPRSVMHTLSFRASTMDPEFFLIDEHRERHEQARGRRRNERTHWWVKSIEETDRVEEVYCAIVPTTHSFVLEGNILTGNCLGCGSHGGLLWFIATMRKISTAQARQWLEDSNGLSADAMDHERLMQIIEAFYRHDQVVDIIPSYSPRVLEPWLEFVHPYLTDGAEDLGVKGRHIPLETIREMKVGWDPEADRIIIPHFWKGSLVGWQARRLWNWQGQKYKSTPDFPKDQTLYNFDPRTRYQTMVVVEAPMSVLSKRHLGIPMAGTFGAEITEAQIRLLSKVDRVIWFLDNDEGGWKPMTGTKDRPSVVERLMPYTQVLTVQNPWDADPADLADSDFLDLVENAVPSVLWKCPAGYVRDYEGGGA